MKEVLQSDLDSVLDAVSDEACGICKDDQIRIRQQKMHLFCDH